MNPIPAKVRVMIGSYDTVIMSVEEAGAFVKALETAIIAAKKTKHK